MKLPNYLLCLLVLGTMTSCYRMPTNEDYSLIPLTNNPDFTKEKSSSPVPGATY